MRASSMRAGLVRAGLVRAGGYKQLRPVPLSCPRICWGKHVRNASTTEVASRDTVETGEASRPKGYEQIAREMAQRSARARSGPRTRPMRADFRARRVHAELTEPVQIGDLVLVNLDPAVVLRTPKAPLDNYVLVNHVGLIKEVQLSRIDARLMPLVPKKLLTTPDPDLYAPDGNFGAPLGIVADNENRDVEVSLEKPTGRVVSWWVYRLISIPLRQVYEQATARAHEILPGLLKGMRALQSTDSPKPTPFLSFVESMLNTPKNNVSVLDFYAVRMCLEHYSLEFKYLLNLSHTGLNAILILPQRTEQRNVHAQRTSEATTDESFLLDYARNNLPLGVCEARAVELLRTKFPQQEIVDSAIAAELLKLHRGGLYDNNWTKWIFEAEDNKQRSQALLQHKRNDVLADHRRVFDKPVYCIDGPDAKEVDDGISLEQVSSEVYKLGIHIANPSAFLDIKGALSSLLPLTSSTYLNGNRTIPLLPAELVAPANLISESGTKPSLSLFVELNVATNELTNVGIEPLTLTNLVNLTYDEVDAHKQPFNKYYEVAVELLKGRYRNGAFSFKNYVDDDLNLLGLKNVPSSEVIVSEFMILANRLVAEYCNKRSIPVWYRKQAVQLQSAEINKAFSSYSKENGNLLGLSWRALVTRSSPSIFPAPHSGLGAAMTTRFTSPLRRLEDLVTHTQLEASLLGEKILPFIEAELYELSDWLQLSQTLSSRLMRMDAQIDQYAQLKRGLEVEGIVSVAAHDAHEQTASLYLPQYGISATYVGPKSLVYGDRHLLRVTEVSSVGRYAHVVLKTDKS